MHRGINRRQFIGAACGAGAAGFGSLQGTGPTTAAGGPRGDILSPTEVERLTSFDAPTISNAIERFGIRPRNEGFMGPEIRCVFPDMPPMVGYAVTAKIRAAKPRDASEHYVVGADWWRYIQTVPSPRVVVIEDLDEPKAVGSYWGEVNGSIHKALGCIGCITDGGVRDLTPVRQMGFHFFAGAVIVSHAYVHMVEMGTPVSVGGLTVNPGELVFGDMHGVITIPGEISGKIADAADEIITSERPLIEYCNSPDFSLDGLIRFTGR